jgi:GTPase SAR1 family protein
MPNLQFRVLVLGRANAGKTTILQRVCETTESPKIYRGGEDLGEEVRYCGSNFYLDV